MRKLFFKKQKFESFDDLNSLITRYEKSEKQKLFYRNRKILAEDDGNDKISEDVRERLIFKTIRYECKFGKNYHGSEAEVRQTRYVRLC